MSRTVTVQTLITRVRQRSDLENDLFITDAEIIDHLDQSYSELWELIAESNEDYLPLTGSITINVTASVQDYSLPSDFLTLRGLDFQISSPDQFVPVPRAEWADRNRWITTPTIGTANVTFPGFGYKLFGRDNMKLLPTPNSAATLRLFYVQTAPILSASGQSIDGVDGFEEYVVLDAAIKCMVKDHRGDEIAPLETRKAELRARVIELRGQRDTGKVASIMPHRRRYRGRWSRWGAYGDPWAGDW